jgi:hypothetical protein
MRTYTVIAIAVFAAISNSLFSQKKQANTVGSELYADAPYRIKKNNDSGHNNGIPIHFYIHDSECIGCNNELLDIQIKIKNANDHSFGSALTFNSYTDSAFNTLLSCRSPYDSYLDKMDFNASGFQKDGTSTIIFTADHSIFYTYYVDITHRNWYFTLTIPEDKLIGFNDVIDIEVNFSLNLEPDQQKYLRVYRYNDDIPKIQGWYRGDTHYHSFYTQNQAENGLPMEATKLAAKYVGLDWITISDHSCDFDNYGGSMADNWQYFGNEVAAMNSQDSSFMFIRGVEMSIKNSEGKVVHALTYPSPDSPFGLPYLGDGGGDLVTTNVSVVGLLDSLANYGGFAYSAHPFAEKDGLPFLINGGLWNIGDTAFPVNGENFPSGGVVGCNNLAEASDFYSLIQNEVFKESLIGGQIWNLRNSLSTSDEPDNPWNALYSSATPFALIDPNSTDHFMNRFNENLDVMDLFWKRSLGIKNQYPSTKNWKFFMSAGSDAHGSFNYSNTDQTMGVYGSVNDNAIGRLSTIAYCPDGMGHNGSNILKSLKKGQTVLSDGPIVTLGISTDGNDQTMEINIGEDTVLTDANIATAKLIVNVQTTAEYGNVSNVFLTGFLVDSIYYYNLPVATGIQSFNLKQTLENLFGQIPNNEYFLIKATLVTLKDYGTLSALYNKTLENFHSFTNPIWIKQTSTFDIAENIVDFNYSVYPNPASDKLYFDFGNINAKNCIVKIIDITGKAVASKTGKADFIDISGIADGFYIVSVSADGNSVTKKFVVSHRK